VFGRCKTHGSSRNEAEFSVFERARFPGAIFRLRKPKTVTLLFGTGKMVCVGAKSEKEAKKPSKNKTKKRISREAPPTA